MKLYASTLYIEKAILFCKSISKHFKRLLCGPKTTRDTDVQTLRVNSSHTFLIRIILFSYNPIAIFARQRFYNSRLTEHTSTVVDCCWHNFDTIASQRLIWFTRCTRAVINCRRCITRVLTCIDETARFCVLFIIPFSVRTNYAFCLHNESTKIGEKSFSPKNVKLNVRFWILPTRVLTNFVFRKQ